MALAGRVATIMGGSLAIIDSARQLALGDRFVREGRWAEANLPLGRRVSGKRLGIVGLGRIGEAVAKRSAGFDMAVRYHNRRPVAGSPYEYEANLLELARWADFLVLSCPGGPQTQNLIDRAVLDALGAKGILINVARGSVVDEAALIAHVKERLAQVAGAAGQSCCAATALARLGHDELVDRRRRISLAGRDGFRLGGERVRQRRENAARVIGREAPARDDRRVTR